MEEKIELNENELSNVSGGGMGTIPAEGITYSNYSDVQSNYYYAKSNKTEFAYVYEIEGAFAHYTIEKLSTIDNNWYFKNTTRTNFSETVTKFAEVYPYRLNIRP